MLLFIIIYIYIYIYLFIYLLTNLKFSINIEKIKVERDIIKGKLD